MLRTKHNRKTMHDPEFNNYQLVIKIVLMKIRSKHLFKALHFMPYICISNTVKLFLLRSTILLTFIVSVIFSCFGLTIFSFPGETVYFIHLFFIEV